MSERLDRIEQGLEGLNQSLNFLVTEFIRPNAQQAYANYERLERIEKITQDNADSIAGNAQQIAELKKAIEGNAQQISELKTLVNANAINIGRLETVADSTLSEIRDSVNEQSQLLEVLVEENRTTQVSQREALRAILSNANRIDTLERQAS